MSALGQKQTYLGPANYVRFHTLSGHSRLDVCFGVESGRNWRHLKESANSQKRPFRNSQALEVRALVSLRSPDRPERLRVDVLDGDLVALERGLDVSHESCRAAQQVMRFSVSH